MGKQTARKPGSGKGACPCGSGRRLEDCCRSPGFATRFGQAIALHQHRHLDAAATAYAALRQEQPENPDVIHYQGVVALQRGDLETALDALRQAVALRPAQAAFRINLAIALTRAGALPEALAHYEAALAAEPGHHQCALYRIRLLERMNRPDDALQALETLLQAAPQLAEAWEALGDKLFALARLDEAYTAYQQALRLNPALLGALEGVAHLAQRFGLHEPARQGYERILARVPAGGKDWLTAWENCLFIMGNVESDGDRLLKAHRDFARQKKAPERVTVLHQRGDRLRVGYLSSDLREHAMRFFARPLLQSFSPERCEVFVYAAHPASQSDAVTQELQRAKVDWNDISSLDDEQAAKLIREHRLDFLIDLNGYTANHRIGVLEHQPASRQGTMLGYMATTGHPCVDFRIADPVAIPAGREAWFSEQIWRLPNAQWCFVPDADAPPVGALPFDRNGVVSFGCFHSATKITDAVMTLYAQVLAQLPRSRLVFVVRGEHATARLRSFFAAKGLQDRLHFLPAGPYAEYLRYYDEIDIALDVFPYAGGTVSCESLWMGVPFLSLAMDAPAGRGGASILTAAGLPELIAGNADEFVAQCCRLANDVSGLREYRRSLRSRLAASSLMDVGTYMRSFEQLLLSHA